MMQVQFVQDVARRSLLKVSPYLKNGGRVIYAPLLPVSNQGHKRVLTTFPKTREILLENILKLSLPPKSMKG
jgi:hypothetical protein